MVKPVKERDKLTLSFAAEELKKPMNELLNSWEERGYRLSTKGVTALIEMNHLSNSDHFSLVSSTYHYIYRNLKKVYGENQDALYEAVDEVLSKVVQIDTSQLMSEIQRKSEEGRQLSLRGASDIAPLPKELMGAQTQTLPQQDVIQTQAAPAMPTQSVEIEQAVLNTQQMIQAQKEAEQYELQKQEALRLQQEKEAFEAKQRQFEEMQRQMALQMQQMAQMQQELSQATTPSIETPSLQQPMVEEEEEETNKKEASQGFASLMSAPRPY